jgi:hypothetical protein
MVQFVPLNLLISQYKEAISITKIQIAVAYLAYRRVY